MTTVIVASQNPVKIAAARDGFGRLFPQDHFDVSGMAAPSGVSAQPMSRAETLRGAQNRARFAATAHPNAAYTVGIEGGIEPEENALAVFAWVVVQHNGRQSHAQTGVFYLPDEVAQLVRSGLELGEADDRVFARNNSKQQTGSIGILTGDVLTRATYYEQAVIMALIPFKNTHLTWR